MGKVIKLNRVSVSHWKAETFNGSSCVWEGRLELKVPESLLTLDPGVMGKNQLKKTESHEQKWWKQISGESEMKLNVSFSCM